MSGHFPPEVGRAMEDEFAVLIERLGYRVLRKRDVKSGLDIIAKFDGRPINPKPLNPCDLIRPLFAPEGITAFSLKRGDFRKSDVDELLEKAKKVKSFSDDKVLRSIRGKVMVTNYSKSEVELNKLLSKNVYCWDMRRLIFYSAKARSSFDLAEKGPVEEVLVRGAIKASYLMETETGTDAILTNVIILVDDHDPNLVIGYDHIKNILVYIYKKSLKPIVKSTRLDVQSLFKFHILGVADKGTVENAYLDYAKEESYHPQVVFSAMPIIFQYGAAPWTTLLKL